MNAPDIRAMCAIGRRGQLGLHGRLPWEGEVGEVYRRDVERFFAQTKGHVVIAGPKTIASVPDWARVDTTFMEIRSHMEPGAVLAELEGRRVFVGGGPAVWAVYSPHITIWDITRLPYDGPADRWFDAGWLIQNRPSIEAVVRSITS